MSNRASQIADKVGQSPGSLVYIGKKQTKQVQISELRYASDFCSERILDSITDVTPVSEKEKIWINVNGVHDINVIEEIGQQFQIDKLVLEDIVNTQHRPKAEDDTNFLYITIKSLTPTQTEDKYISEQVSLLLGKDYLITFEEVDSKAFGQIRERLVNGIGNARNRKLEFLFYRLLDTIVDNYYLVNEYLNDAVDALEDRLLDNPNEDVQNDIYALKKRLSNLKRTIGPTREAISMLTRSENEFLEDTTKTYLRDVHEHIVHISDAVDSHRESLNDFLNMYMSGLSNKMNEVMKVLTIFASIFIPLTFIAGIYGMNFEIMPELKWEYGYFIVWGVMLAVAIALLYYFRKNKWL